MDPSLENVTHPALDHFAMSEVGSHNHDNGLDESAVEVLNDEAQNTMSIGSRDDTSQDLPPIEGHKPLYTSTSTCLPRGIM